MKALSILAFLIVSALGATPALAQCSSFLAGTTSEEIRNNEQRIICQQRDVAAETERRNQQMEVDALDRRIRQLELQQRLNSLPRIEPPRVVTIPRWDE